MLERSSRSARDYADGTPDTPPDAILTDLTWLSSAAIIPCGWSVKSGMRLASRNSAAARARHPTVLEGSLSRSMWTIAATSERRGRRRHGRGLHPAGRRGHTCGRNRAARRSFLLGDVRTIRPRRSVRPALPTIAAVYDDSAEACRPGDSMYFAAVAGETLAGSTNAAGTAPPCPGPKARGPACRSPSGGDCTATPFATPLAVGCTPAGNSSTFVPLSGESRDSEPPPGGGGARAARSRIDRRAAG